VGQFSGRLKNSGGLGAILGAIHLRTVVDTIGQGCTLDPF
jgi:hypothetical protein